MGQTFDKVMKIIHEDHDPYANFEIDKWPDEPFGWIGHTEYFDRAIDTLKPEVYLEFGVLFGASARYAAQRMISRGIDGCVVASDTFLQEEVLWNIPGHRAQMRMKNGRSTAYEMFMRNTIKAGLQNYIIPLAMDTHGAARYMISRGIKAKVIYLDACHVGGDVYRDLLLMEQLMDTGGAIIGDDYEDNYCDVRDDFNKFVAERGYKLESKERKVIIYK
jgi:hypothetical protein